MKIFITWGVGEGKTMPAAFDHALWNAGIGNYNLIKLSSIIPDNSEIIVGKLNRNDIEHGYKLWVVFSKRTEIVVGKEAWAGLGWITANKSHGRGVFVEGSGRSKEEVARLIKETIDSIGKHRLEEHGSINYKITGIKCEGKPVCAVVAAIYKSEGWD